MLKEDVKKRNAMYQEQSVRKRVEAGGLILSKYILDRRHARYFLALEKRYRKTEGRISRKDVLKKALKFAYTNDVGVSDANI